MGLNDICRMRNFQSCFLLLAVVFIAQPSFANSPDICVGANGEELCSAAEPTEWYYSLCDRSQLSTSRAKRCVGRGGTWAGVCTGARPNSESNMIPNVLGIGDQFLGGGAPYLVSDTGWGATYDNFVCGAGATRYDDNILLGDARIMVVGASDNDATFTFWARRTRRLVCERGTKSASIDGRAVCLKDKDFDQCGVGNPIVPSTGRKIQTEIDMDFLGISAKRHYSSQSWFIPYNHNGPAIHSAGMFGDNWRSNFDYRLYPLLGNDAAVAITFPRGEVLYFDSNFTPILGTGASGILSREGDVYVLETADKKLTFSSGGLLTRMENISGGEVLELKYSGVHVTDVVSYNPDFSAGMATIPDNLLISVKNTVRSSELAFAYDAGGRVVKVNSGTDAVYYQYDDFDNIKSVRYADGVERSYLYENAAFPKLLTGIRDEKGIIFAKWTYDDVGRALSSEHAEGAERVVLDYSNANSTSNPYVLVTSPLAKQAHYVYQSVRGNQKLIKVEGQASQNCAAAARFRSYYEDGTLQTQTDWEGNVTLYQYDDFGRKILEQSGYQWIGSPVYGVAANPIGSLEPSSSLGEVKEIRTCWHPSFNRPERIIDNGQVTIYKYDPQGRISSQQVVPRSPENERCL